MYVHKLASSSFCSGVCNFTGTSMQNSCDLCCNRCAVLRVSLSAISVLVNVQPYVCTPVWYCNQSLHMIPTCHAMYLRTQGVSGSAIGHQIHQATHPQTHAACSLPALSTNMMTRRKGLRGMLPACMSAALACANQAAVSASKWSTLHGRLARFVLACLHHQHSS